MTATLFGLLTRIRVSRAPTDLAKAARQQHLFPLVGAVVGLFAAIVSVLFYELFGKEMALVSAGLALFFLYYVTGILHTEGLADFADGIMASGPQERKRGAMKDVHLGSAGVFSTVLFLIVFFSAVTRITVQASHPLNLFPLPWGVPVAVGFVLSEMAGKLSMNTMMYLGPSSHQGMGSVFVTEASAKKLATSLGICVVIGTMASGLLFFIVLLGLITGALATHISRKNFGGVGGDAFGAANELGRIVALLGWVLLI